MPTLSLGCLDCRATKKGCDATREFKDDDWAVSLALGAALKAQRKKTFHPVLPPISQRTIIKPVKLELIRMTKEKREEAEAAGKGKKRARDDEDDDEEEDQGRKKAAGKSKKRARDDDEHEEGAKVGKGKGKKPVDDDEEEDTPTEKAGKGKKRAHEDDEEEEEPSRAKSAPAHVTHKRGPPTRQAKVAKRAKTTDPSNETDLPS